MNREKTVVKGLVERVVLWIRNVFKRSPVSVQRPPELGELEAQFYRDSETDAEKLRNRLFSNSVRSGRG